jgi:hypothetical protein
MAAELPSAAHLHRDGALCLMAWADRLPARIAPTVLAVLVQDPALFDLHPLGDDYGNKAASLAKAWLNADRAGGS